jgi:hypothetical protein
LANIKLLAQKSSRGFLKKLSVGGVGKPISLGSLDLAIKENVNGL